MIPKRVRTVDPDGLKRFREVMESEAVKCNWFPVGKHTSPEWCKSVLRSDVGLGDWIYCEGPMEVAHIEPRRMGGGSRDDSPQNLAWLCRKHHRQFDAGQSREKIEAMKAHIQRTRHPAIKRLLGYEE